MGKCRVLIPSHSHSHSRETSLAIPIPMGIPVLCTPLVATRPDIDNIGLYFHSFVSADKPCVIIIIIFIIISLIIFNKMTDKQQLTQETSQKCPRVGSGCVLCTRIDPLRFLAGCRRRRLNQGLVVALGFFLVVR